MNDITQTAIRDCQEKKIALSGQVVQLQDDLRRSEQMREKAEELAAKWEATACQIHDERMAAQAEVQRLQSLTMWDRFKFWMGA